MICCNEDANTVIPVSRKQQIFGYETFLLPLFFNRREYITPVKDGWYKLW